MLKRFEFIQQKEEEEQRRREVNLGAVAASNTTVQNMEDESLAAQTLDVYERGIGTD